MLILRLITAVLLSALAISGCETKRIKPAIAVGAKGPPSWAIGRRTFPPDVTAVLEQAEVVEVVSLDPRDYHEEGTSHFRGFLELGRVRIDDQSTHRKLIDALAVGVHEGHGLTLRTFQPRHAIHCVKSGSTC